MTAWTATVNGWSNQGHGTFEQVVEEVAQAQRDHLNWDVMVRGPYDSAYRPLTSTEARRLVQAVTEELAR